MEEKRLPSAPVALRQSVHGYKTPGNAGSRRLSRKLSRRGSAFTPLASDEPRMKLTRKFSIRRESQFQVKRKQKLLERRDTIYRLHEAGHSTSLSLEVGSCSLLGKRPQNEDVHCHLVHPEFNVKHNLPQEAPLVSYFGVFDGHGGKPCAAFCERHIQERVIKHEGYMQGDYENSLRQAIEETDIDYVERCAKAGIEYSSGSTVVAAILDHAKLTLTVANVGDSRCILGGDGEVWQVTKDHKPTDPEEKQRIEEGKGRIALFEHSMDVTPCQYCFLSGWNRFTGSPPARVWPGGLSLSRAMGDVQTKGREPRLIISKPDVFQRKLSVKDDFLVIACDGLWDVLSNKNVASYVRSHMLADIPLEQVATGLAKRAIAAGSSDNVTVVVVQFHWKKEEQPEAAPLLGSISETKPPIKVKPQDDS